MKAKKTLLIAALFIMALLLASCGACNADTDYVPDDVDNGHGTEIDNYYTSQPPGPVVGTNENGAGNLGGMEIIIATWWSDYDTATITPGDLAPQERAIWEMRTAAEQQYNFRIREVNMGNEAEVIEIAANSMAEGNPAAHIFALPPLAFTQLNVRGLLAPLDGYTTNFDDNSVIDWNIALINATKTNNVPHGWAHGLAGGDGIFFNMRLLEEAGIDPYLPFNLQLAGAWNWHNFMEIAHQLSENTWAMAGSVTYILPRMVAANNAAFVGRDPEAGLFYNATGSPEFMEALAFVQSLHDEGLVMPQAEYDPWNWYEAAFLEGRVAMRPGGANIAAHINANLHDPWGFVAFPLGPNASMPHYHFTTIDMIFAIPNTFTPQEVDNILFAWQQWSATPEGFDDTNEWMYAALEDHHTHRSVRETMAQHTRNHANALPMMHAFIPGLRVDDISWALWQDDTDISAIIENMRPSWDAIIGAANQ